MQGNFIAAFCKELLFVADSMMAEAYALGEGLCFATRVLGRDPGCFCFDFTCVDYCYQEECAILEDGLFDLLDNDNLNLCAKNRREILCIRKRVKMINCQI
jgi:hypothetical protein